MCGNCNKPCEGIPLSSTCLIWEGKKYDFNSFNELVEYVVDTAKTYLEKPNVDLKTLSDKDLTRDQILQLFVDKFLQSQSQQISQQECSIDISAINPCTNCSNSFCDKLQVLVDKVASQQAEIEQLKQTVYN